MRTSTIIFFAAFLAIAAAMPTRAAAQDPFEGVVVMHDSMAGKAMDMTYYYKGAKVRIEMSVKKGQEMTYIEDHDAKTTTMIMPSEKMYMTQPFTDVNPKPLSSDEKPVKTGRTATICGYSCEEWTVTTTHKTKTDLWLSHEMPAFLPTMGVQQGSAQAKYADFYKERGFPLRMTLTDSAGKQTMRMEAVKVEKKSLDASLFVPPADYKSLSMPGGDGKGNMRKSAGGQ